MPLARVKTPRSRNGWAASSSITVERIQLRDEAPSAYKDKIRRAQWRTVVSTPKTDRIVTVPMTPELEGVIADWRRQNAKHRHAKSEWLFPSEVGKPHQNSACMTKAFADCLEEIGVDRSFSSRGLRRIVHHSDGHYWAIPRNLPASASWVLIGVLRNQRMTSIGNYLQG